MPQSDALPQLIINSLAAGEISPSVYGRTDLAKFHQGAATMRNFFVDPRGGASTRAGTQYIGAPASSGRARLIPFIFSPNIGQTYMLVFSNLKLRFIKNPGTLSYSNSSNAGFVQHLGSPYEIATPWATADLPYLKAQQIADVMYITRHGYVRYKLSRLADDNWTLTAVVPGTVGVAQPVMSSITISPLPSGSTDPEDTRYMYSVTAVDVNGTESIPAIPLVSSAGINIGATAGSVTITWGPVVGALYYKVYKAVPSPGDVVPQAGEQMGFAGFAYGVTFVDSNVIADYTKTPPSPDDPFTPGAINGYTISNSGATYPVGGTSLTVTDATGPGAGAVAIPVLSTSVAGATGGIVGIVWLSRGANYVTPQISASGGGASFAATLTASALTGGNDPDVVGLFQQRLVYASTTTNPILLALSRPGQFDDFRRTTPPVDSDALVFSIASQQVSDIVWLQSMPGGLVIGTNSGVVQLTGGSSNAGNPTAVTPTNAIIVPQSFYGAADLRPIVINYDILYVQAEGSIVRDLQYNFWVNIYTGTDITVLSNHLFFPNTIVDWAYQDTPNKTIWAVRSDGALLSCCFLKEQEIIGWARHDTSGYYEAVSVVQEGNVDAIYFSVLRGTTRFIERLCDRTYYNVADAWCLDAALSIAPTFPAATITPSAISGTGITITASAGVFSSGDVGSIIASVSARARITAYTDSTHVTATVLDAFSSTAGIAANNWRIAPSISSAGGLPFANGTSVMALVDGLVQGPFTVSGGSITLTTPGCFVVVGLGITCQIQTPYLDTGEPTIQGKRKNLAAVTTRIKDAARLKYGPDFDHLREWVANVDSTDPIEYVTSPGLYLGDQRSNINQTFDRLGAFSIQQDLPLPATILAIIPEIALGDS